jgi:glucosamine--fructose-6-phosphate aminotransferase (isomerizing)
MCGIVGYVGPRNLTNVIMVGLERLEYRGYDSCGIAAIDGGLTIRKTAGRLQKLKELLASDPVTGNPGSGTHAGPRTARLRTKTPIRSPIAVTG